jgi:DNA-directed RNA polymerase subunit omega
MPAVKQAEVSLLTPSYAELMEVLNRGRASDDEITSRYTIVVAAAKRARQLVEGAEPLVHARSENSLSIAVDELYNGKLDLQRQRPAAVRQTRRSGLFDGVFIDDIEIKDDDADEIIEVEDADTDDEPIVAKIFNDRYERDEVEVESYSAAARAAISENESERVEADYQPEDVDPLPEEDDDEDEPYDDKDEQ